MNGHPAVRRARRPMTQAATVALLAFAAPAVPAGISGYPASVEAYDAREVALLPGYCKYTQAFREHVPGGNDQAQIRHWRSVMGERAFEAMHHYCWGMMKTNRAMLLARDARMRQFYLDAAVTEFDYVLRSTPPDFVMLPEILTRKGENLVHLGRGQQAIQALEKAIELKPDYWPPYAYISDYYKTLGDVPKARAVLEQAIAAAPNTTALQRRMAELDTPRRNATP